MKRRDFLKGLVALLPVGVVAAKVGAEETLKPFAHLSDSDMEEVIEVARYAQSFKVSTGHADEEEGT